MKPDAMTAPVPGVELDGGREEGGCTLDVVVEAADPVAVALKKFKAMVVGEVLKLEEAVGP